MEDYKHPIQLERVMFTRTIVIAISEHLPSDVVQVNPAPENALNMIPVEGQEGRYQVNMTSKFNIKGESAYPYIIDMECIGVFLADATLSKEEASR